MKGERMRAMRNALLWLQQHFDHIETLNIVSYSTSAHAAFEKMVPVSRAREIEAFINGEHLEACGDTNMVGGFDEALHVGTGADSIFYMTDGKDTRNSEVRILAAATACAAALAKHAPRSKPPPSAERAASLKRGSSGRAPPPEPTAPSAETFAMLPIHCIMLDMDTKAQKLLRWISKKTGGEFNRASSTKINEVCAIARSRAS